MMMQLKIFWQEIQNDFLIQPYPLQMWCAYISIFPSSLFGHGALTVIPAFEKSIISWIPDDDAANDLQSYNLGGAIVMLAHAYL